MSDEKERAEQPFRTLEAFAALLDGAVDAVLVIDTDGIVRLANPACAELFGRPADEIVGRSINHLMPAAHGERHDEYIREYLRTGERKIIGIGREVEIVDAAGRIRPVHVAVSELTVQGSRYFAGFFRDLSPRRHAEAEIRDRQARISAVLEAAVDAIITIDESGRIESVNPAFERIFGYTAAEVIGRNVSVLMPKPWNREHDTYIRRYLRTGDKKIIGVGREVAARRKDGTVFPVDLSVGEVRLDDGRRLFTGIVRDVSDRKKLLEQIIEQESLSRLGEMATVMAHEVRNPLAGISGALQVLGRRLPKESEGQAVLDEILDRIRALEATVSDILLYARPRPPRRGAVPARMLIDSAVDLVLADPKCASLEIHVSGPDVRIVCDAEQIRAVFFNIVVNAAQVLRGQGRIEIELSTHERGGERVGRIAFRDNGPGIPEDALDRIFDAFYTTRPGGTGLGLAIARRTIEAHAGRIHVGRAEAGGAEFVVELPLAGET